MKIAIYGGSFNPPHLGHLEAAKTVCAELAPDKLLIIPDNIPPHKAMDPGSPSAEERLALCRIAFRSIPGAEISDMEIRRRGKSYTAHTVRELRGRYPDDELFLVVGSDMLLSFEEWYEFGYLLSECTLAVVSREEDDLDALRAHKALLSEKYAARVHILQHAPLPMNSSEIRVWLRLRLGSDLLDNAVYAEIIRRRYYEAMPELCWLREAVKPYLSPRRVAHVAGCESEAVLLAMRYGEDAEAAAEAAPVPLPVALPDARSVSAFSDPFGEVKKPTAARELSAAPDYFAEAKPAIEAMMAQAGHPVFDADGILQKGVILRHLALPGHVDDSFAVLDQMAAWNDADPGCFLPSVMSQYTPFYKAAEHGIGRRITTYEYRRVVNYAMDLGLSSGYMQQKSSAKEEYTPSFDLTGV